MVRDLELKNKILEKIKVYGFISIARTARDFGINYNTARNYLDLLLKEGFLTYDNEEKLYLLK